MADSTHTANTPFIVGVLGYLDFDPHNGPRLHNAVTAFAAEIKRHLPDTELQIIVGMLTSADLLVVQSMLDLAVSVETVLPMPLEEYSRNFSADALTMLKDLSARPDIRCTILRTPAQASAGDSCSSAQRHAMYANLTEALSRRSSLLLTVWDGHSALPGGAANTGLRHVGVRSDGDASEASLVMHAEVDDADSADGLISWIPAAESAGAAIGTVPPSQQSMPAQLARQLAELNGYNREFQHLLADGRFDRRDSLLASLPGDARCDDRLMLVEIDAQYAKADALAVHFQWRSDRLFHLFGVMAFGMGLAYLIYDKLDQANSLLGAYLVLLLFGLAVYHALRDKHWFAKHLSYRAIAETMRATFYLRLASLDQQVDAARVLALSGINRFHGFGLITQVLTAVAVPDVHAAANLDFDPQRSRYIEQTWIDSQHRYFVAKVAKLKRSSLRMKRLKNVLFFVVLLVIIALFLFDRTMRRSNVAPGVSLEKLLTFFEGLLALLLGVWQLHEGKMASRELLWQYRNLRNHFARARQKLSRLTTSSERNDILVALGRDSLMESYLWTIHRYHREHEPPGKN